jgi:excisionase family DNA binding protein
MTQRIFPIIPGQQFDERQLALLVGLCVAACTEVLRGNNSLGVAPDTDIHKSRSTAYTSEKAGTEANGQREQDHQQAAATEQKLLLTVEEAAERLSVGRPKMWQLVMTGEVLSVKIGASCHLDHDPRTPDPRLAVLYQACHPQLDAMQHRRSRRRMAREREVAAGQLTWIPAVATSDRHGFE